MVSTKTTGTHGISVNVYGRGDISKSDGPSHIGIALFKRGESTCRIHHIRCPDDEHFFYDPRSFPLDGPVLWGRCVLAELDESELQRAESILTEYGQANENIPEMGSGNCQDWVAGAVVKLEAIRLVSAGEGAFWREQINRSGDEMAANCQRTGRDWIAGETRIVDPSTIDAKFSDVEVRKVGKLTSNPAFQSLVDPERSSKSLFTSSLLFSSAHRERMP